MADPLAAASLLVAILAVLFGAWNSDVVAALRINVEVLRANRRPQRRQMMDALFSKALPLSVGAWLTLLVFAPRSASLIKTAYNGWATYKFDDVAAAFILTEAFAITIGLWLSVLTVRLSLKLIASFGADR